MLLPDAHGVNSSVRGIESDGAAAHAEDHVAIGIEGDVMRAAAGIARAQLSLGDHAHSFPAHSGKRL